MPTLAIDNLNNFDGLEEDSLETVKLSLEKYRNFLSYYQNQLKICKDVSSLAKSLNQENYAKS